MERAPDLLFKHYTADELQLPSDVVVALGNVRLSEVEVCADVTPQRLQPRAHRSAPVRRPAIQLLERSGQLVG